jgi:hypothetical protein
VKEADVAKLERRNHKKLDNCGCICMFVGYSISHARDTNIIYGILDPKELISPMAFSS